MLQCFLGRDSRRSRNRQTTRNEVSGCESSLVSFSSPDVGQSSVPEGETATQYSAGSKAKSAEQIA